jgi:GTPase-associated protein 1, N-terminal domain type 2/GTPase-associated protein 1, C-terminal domain/GTPase-associated protein 1, middle domain
MGFAQLYYTSCEIGLSGFAGFQFNAVTPGLSPDVLRNVESLTAYRPPHWLSVRPTAAEIQACPVNLVYTSTPATILANVVFVGTDFSQRSGNYFAHALVSQTGVDAFEGILPIEFWGSPIWVSEPIRRTELPRLPQLPEPSPDGPLSRADVARFLDGGSRREHLAVLLTAAENAVLRGGRPIVIVHPDTVEAARWIAAISFLLRPAVARRLSFSTYHRSPGHIDVHVTATLPDSDFDVNEGSFRSYIVLDEATGRISDVAPEPAADLLVRAGPGQAAALWEHAARLARITGDSLADWHPALVMAAVLDGPEVTTSDLDALSGWLLQHAAGVSPGERGAVLRRILGNPAFRPRHLAALATMSRLDGDHELAVRIERAVAEVELRRVADPAGTDIGTGVPIVTAEGKAFAVSQCAERLAGASAPVAISLLGWSTDLGLELAEATLRACGERILGPQLVARPDEDTLGVLAGARPLIEGALAHLVAVAGLQPEAVVRALAAGLDDVASKARVTLPDPLAEAALMASVSKHPENRMAALSQFLAHDRDGSLRLSERLLGRIWPEGRWTAAETLAAIGALEPERVLAEPVRAWVVRGVLEPFDDGGYLSSYRQLCQALQASGLAGKLPEEAKSRLDAFAATSREIERAEAERGRNRAVIIRQLASSYPDQSPPVQDLLCEALVSQPEKMAGSRYLPHAVGTYPKPVVSAFLGATRGRLAAPADIDAVARLFRCLTALRHARDALIAPGLEKTLREGLGLWRRGDLNRLNERLRDTDQETADEFAAWRQQHLAAGPRRSWRWFRPGRS